jgi:isopenicillin-N epimerase
VPGQLRVAPQWQQHIHPLVPSHDYREGYQPAFDWTGTFDPIPLLAIPAALDFWAELGWEEVRRHQHELVTDGAHKVATRLGTNVSIRDEFTASMRLVELPKPLSKDDGRALSQRLTLERMVTAYVTHHEGRSYIRLCGQLYNVPEHYARLADALPALL